MIKKKIGLLGLSLWLLMTGFARAQIDDLNITVGSKNFPESYILAEIIAQVIEQSEGVSVERKLGMGGTGLVYQALKNGEVDLYPEYTGTIGQAILKDPRLKDLSSLRRALREKGMFMTQPLGFNNTYALGVRQDTAESLSLKKISDLKNHPQIRAAFSYEFMKRADGYPALSKAYGFQFQSVKGMEHSLAYEAIKNKEVDLVDVYTTDAKLEKLGLVLLEDDQSFFPRYDAVILARKEFAIWYPRAWEALLNLQGRINDQLMSRLNAMAEIDKKSFAAVASLFLDSQEWVRLSEKQPLTPEQESLSQSYIRQTQSFWLKLIQLTQEHLFLVFVSLTFSILVGIPLGVFSYTVPRLGQMVLGLTGVVQTIPSLALLCFFIPLFGIGTLPALAALFLYGLLPIVRNTHSGLQSLDPKLVEVAQALGLSPLQKLRYVQLPLASVHIVSGIKTSAVINVGTATLAALIGAGGYGTLIVTGLALNDLALILKGALPAAALAILIHWLFESLDLVLIPKGLRLAALSLVAFLGLSGVSQAVPAITEASGEVVQDSPLTIKGNGFGFKSQVAPLIWDNLESGQFHSDWADTADLSINSNNQRTAQSKFNAYLNFTRSRNDADFRAGNAVHQKWFVQYWFKIGTNWDWGDTGYSGNNRFLSNIKIFRMWNPGSSDENFVVALLGWENNGIYTVENVANPPQDRLLRNFRSKITKGQWHLLQFEYKDNSNVGAFDGEFRAWFNGEKIAEEIGMLTREDFGGLKRPFIIGFDDVWGPNGGAGETDRSPNDFYIDDIYMDKSWSRVEIGDQAIYENCQHREIQIPTQWSTTEVDINVQTGSFAAGRTVYLYVVDASGQVNPTGFPLTIGETVEGGGGSGDEPEQPSPGGGGPGSEPPPDPGSKPVEEAPAVSPAPSTSVPRDINLVKPGKNAVIFYSLVESTSVKISVLNRRGEEVRILENSFKAAGDQAVSWDGRNKSGSKVAPGHYLIKFDLGDRIESRRVVVIK